MSESLSQTLKKLRLSGLAASLEVRLQEAAASGLNHREFLELILQDELFTRNSPKREATAVGLGTTEIGFPAQRLPPVSELSVEMEPLGMARPHVYDDVLEIKLRVADEDVALRPGTEGPDAVVVRVHNEGSVDAERVAVILHQHEPAIAQRTGAASRMIEAQVVAVPAAGAAEAEFVIEDRSVLSDLWVEIEQLDVGAPHVPRDRGKARLPVAEFLRLRAEAENYNVAKDFPGGYSFRSLSLRISATCSLYCPDVVRGAIQFA